MEAKTNNKILMATRKLCYEYWKTNNSMVDYFLIHMFMELACNYYREEYSQIVKFCNSMPHVLLLEMFEPYDEEKYSAIKAITPFHKLANLSRSEKCVFVIIPDFHLFRICSGKLTYSVILSDVKTIISYSVKCLQTDL